jgi:UTP--glucose-1-phosphate uridylyltransferase
MGKFRTFSTNNLWVNLGALSALMKDKTPSLSLIVNPKVVDGIDVLQLETAMGSAIGSFHKTKGIIIPRDRFAPVKKCEDYLIRRSDAYVLNEDFSLTMNPIRKQAGLGENLVSLDDKFYKKLKPFEKLCKVTPSLLHCKSLKVEGEVEFDVHLVLKGDVVIKNTSGELRKVSAIGKSELKDETVNL